MVMCAVLFGRRRAAGHETPAMAGCSAAAAAAGPFAPHCCFRTAGQGQGQQASQTAVARREQGPQPPVAPQSQIRLPLWPGTTGMASGGGSG